MAEKNVEKLYCDECSNSGDCVFEAEYRRHFITVAQMNAFKIEGPFLTVLSCNDYKYNRKRKSNKPTKESLKALQSTFAKEL